MTSIFGNYAYVAVAVLDLILVLRCLQLTYSDADEHDMVWLILALNVVFVETVVVAVGLDGTLAVLVAAPWIGIFLYPFAIRMGRHANRAAADGAKSAKTER